MIRDAPHFISKQETEIFCEQENGFILPHPLISPICFNTEAATRRPILCAFINALHDGNANSCSLLLWKHFEYFHRRSGIRHRLRVVERTVCRVFVEDFHNVHQEESFLVRKQTLAFILLYPVEILEGSVMILIKGFYQTFYQNYISNPVNFYSQGLFQSF